MAGGFMNELVEDMLSLGFTPYQIKLALESGEWLKAADISQEEAEEAHAVVTAMQAKIKENNDGT
jgi:uncharacterized protein YeaC (DUF1315 family)